MVKPLREHRNDRLEADFQRWKFGYGVAAFSVLIVVLWALYKIISIDHHMIHTPNAQDQGTYWAAKKLGIYCSLVGAGSVLIVTLVFQIMTLERTASERKMLVRMIRRCGSEGRADQDMVKGSGHEGEVSRDEAKSTG